MDKIPYVENKEIAAEYLRLTIALLSKHRIPLSPFNYRLGYDYISGKNETLKKALNDVITKSETPCADTLWDLYNQYYIQDDKTLVVIRGELKTIKLSTVIKIFTNSSRPSI